ncbi:MAG TPA: ABC transporter ATP-binding protein [Mobilitalea sp.]|nr:ABC transporter ATP-binding protein [Mobilitalea sp.]
MVLECKELRKKYLGKTVVDNVSFVLEEGSIYALLGQNGSGKTTLMKMITGLVKADQGEMTFQGEKLGVKAKEQIAYMPTEAYFYDYMKTKDVGKYYADFFEDFNKQHFDELLIQMDIHQKDRIKHLSSGQIAKLKLAVTLARNAKLYLLDEPLNGIDLLSRDIIITIILEASREDNMIVISSHLVEELEKIVDHIILLNKGRVSLVGEAEEIRETRGKSITDVYREVLA